MFYDGIRLIVIFEFFYVVLQNIHEAFRGEERIEYLWFVGGGV